MQKLLIATGNIHKAREIIEILDNFPIQSETLQNLTKIPQEPEETGQSFAENALIKAQYYAQYYCGWVLADDSGFVVPALDGAPGLWSARYAGEQSTDADNRNLLIKNLLAKNIQSSEAYFVCNICLFRPEMDPRQFEAKWLGEVITEEKGSNGFGYDPLFLIPQMGKTSSELSPQQKNTISHRGMALKKLMTFLSELF